MEAAGSASDKTPCIVIADLLAPGGLFQGVLAIFAPCAKEERDEIFEKLACLAAGSAAAAFAA
jgi:hypothetical protein